MYCLHCGDCCIRMSPLTSDDTPCPKLIKDNTFYFCSINSHKPKQCNNHRFPAHICPIGMSVLGYTTLEEARIRIDEGYEKIKLLV